MKKKRSLEASMILLLFLIVIGGKSIEGTAYALRDAMPWHLQKIQAATSSPEQMPSEYRTPITRLNQQVKKTRQISGEVVAVHPDAIEIKTNKKVTRFSLPSNTFVFRNGADATVTQVKPHDFVFATVSGNNVVRMSAFSGLIVLAVKASLLASLIFSSYCGMLLLLDRLYIRFIMLPKNAPLKGHATA